jgi:hypothetical protein
MPGSATTPSRTDTRNNAPVRFAFRAFENVGARDYQVYAARWLAYALPCRRFAVILADANARLGANADCYSFIAVDLHHLLFAGFYRRTENKTWHSRKLLGPDFWTSNWQCDDYGVPFEDYVPDVITSIREVITPFIETASPADQKRIGSFPFVTNCFKMLQLSQPVIVTRDELRSDEPPRWMREEQLAERSHAC